MLDIEGGVMNSEDRELLGFAAKAIGYELYVNLASASQLYKDGKYVRFWNPLQDDGDAFRLMTKLGINVSSIGLVIYATSLLSGGISVYENRDGVDAFSATRRAIVRAAAEIGRNAA